MNRKQITDALQTLKQGFGASIFSNPKLFQNAVSDLRIAENGIVIKNLLITAICELNAYTRLEKALADGNLMSVENLATEMSTDYSIDKSAAKMVIDSIAEMCGYEPKISLAADGILMPMSAISPKLAKVQELRKYRDCIAAGLGYTLGLRTDGTVKGVGQNHYGQCDVEDWTGIVAIAADYWVSVGLKADGTVIDIGNRGEANLKLYSGLVVDKCRQSSTQKWREIVAISTGNGFITGLKSDGRVVIARLFGHEEKDLDPLEVYYLDESGDVVAIDGQTMLKSDGTVKASDTYDTKGWRNIIAIGEGNQHIVGLTADGTVVATGNNNEGQCDVGDWSDIVDIKARENHTAGLKSDGTVVCAGKDWFGARNTRSWQNIIAISVGRDHTVGLKKDGTIVAVGKNYNGECNVGNFKGIGCADIQKLSQNTSDTHNSIEQQKTLWEKQGLCPLCGGKLSFFTKKCKTCATQKHSANQRGSIIGNRNMASDNEWLYYAHGKNGCLYKIKEDRTGRKKLNNEGTTCVNVIGDWVYYLNRDDKYSIYKIKTDGTERQQLCKDDCNNLRVIGNLIFYQNDSDESKIFGMLTDGTDRKKYVDVSCSAFIVLDDWIYYADKTDGDKLYKIRLDGNDKQLLIEDGCTYINIVDNWIYFCNKSDGWKVYRAKSNGSAKQKILDHEGSGSIIYNGWVYYIHSDVPFSTNKGDIKLCRIKTDGTQPQQLCVTETRSNLEIINNYIYFSDYNHSYKIKTDGTDLQCIQQ